MSAPETAAVSAKQRPSWAALFERPYALPAAVVVLGVLSPAFSFFVTATVLPSVIREIGGLALYAWTSTAYSVASILGSAGSAVVTRKTGTRAALVIASVVFVAGASVCAMAPSMPMLIAGRSVQGLGGGMMIAGVHAVVREVFPEALWSRMLATISGAWGIAAMSGPAVGGVFAQLGSWRSAFWATVPLAVVAAVMMWRILPRAEPRSTTASGVPFGRLTLVCASVLCVGSIANVRALPARIVLLLGALSAIALALRLDRHAAERLFPDRMLSVSQPVGKGFWMIFFLAMCTTPGSVYVALLLQILQELPPAGAGYFYAAQSLAWTIAALLSARLTGASVRVALVLGPIMIGTGFIGVCATIATGPVAATALSIVLVGGGIGACWAHVGAIVLGSARHGEGAVTASMIPTTQTFGVALGAAVSGIIANAAGLSSSASRPVAALAATWLFGSFVVVPLGALLIGTRLPVGGATFRRTT